MMKYILISSFVMFIFGAITSIVNAEDKVTLELNNYLYTNFQRNSNPLRETYAHAFKGSAEIKRQFGDNFKLEIFPGADIKYGYSPDSDLSTFFVWTEFVGYQKGSSWTTYKPFARFEYVKEFDFNDEYEFTKNQFYMVDLNGGLEHKFNDVNSFNFKLGGRLFDYTTPTSSVNPDERDNLVVYTELVPKFIAAKWMDINFPLYSERVMMRTKKALLKRGAAQSNKAETIQSYTAKMETVLKARSVTLVPAIGYKWSDDQVEGAKSYHGVLGSFRIEYSKEDIGINSEIIVEDKDYDHQQVDVNETVPDLAEKLHAKFLKVINTFEIKKIANKPLNIVVEHIVEETSSNRAGDGSINQTFKLGFKLAI